MDATEERESHIFLPKGDGLMTLCEDNQRIGYIKGATEQHKIDVEKACIAHCNLCEYNHLQGCIIYAVRGQCNDIQLIRKAMEE